MTVVSKASLRMLPNLTVGNILSLDFFHVASDAILSLLPMLSIYEKHECLNIHSPTFKRSFALIFDIELNRKL